LLSEPKQLPQTAFSIVFTEEAKKGGDVKSRATEASQRYKNLSAEEREVCFCVPRMIPAIHIH
jgi:hypothetical protein